MHLQSGIEYGVTLGTPISLLVKNEDQRPHDYSETDLYPRPSHADYTYLEKYGIKASSGGGRSSARETIGVLRISPLDSHGVLIHVQAGSLQVPSPRSISNLHMASRSSHLFHRWERSTYHQPWYLHRPMMRTLTTLKTQYLRTSGSCWQL